MKEIEEAKKKDDLSENPEQGVDTSMGRYYLEMGLVKIIEKAKQLEQKHYES